MVMAAGVGMGGVVRVVVTALVAAVAEVAEVAMEVTEVTALTVAVGVTVGMGRTRSRSCWSAWMHGCLGWSAAGLMAAQGAELGHQGGLEAAAAVTTTTRKRLFSLVCAPHTVGVCSGGSGGSGGPGGRGGTYERGGETHRHSNGASGASGSSGRSGRSGQSGSHGHRGSQGRASTVTYIATYSDGHQEKSPANADPVVSLSLTELQGLGEQDGVLSPGEKVKVTAEINNRGGLTIPAGGQLSIDCPVFYEKDQQQLTDVPELKPGDSFKFEFFGAIDLATPHKKASRVRGLFGFPAICEGWGVGHHPFEVLYAVYPKDFKTKAFVHRAEDVRVRYLLENFTDIEYGHNHGRAITLVHELVSGPAALSVTTGLPGPPMWQVIESRQVDSVSAKTTIPTTVELQVDEQLTSWQSEERQIVVRVSAFLNEFGKIYEGTETMTVVRFRQRVATVLCAIPICGILGAHRWYTAKWMSALAMLIVTLLATAVATDQAILRVPGQQQEHGAVVLLVVLIISWVDLCKIRSLEWRDGYGDPLSAGVLGAPPFSGSRPKEHVRSYEETAPKDLPSFEETDKAEGRR